MATIDGTLNNDTITPFEAFAFDGTTTIPLTPTTTEDDVVYGMDGSDYIDGGSGNDILYGGKKADELIGGLGDDSLFGGKGNDYLLGLSGNDVLKGGTGDDILSGFKGDDTAVYNGNSSGYTFGPLGSFLNVTDIDPADGNDGSDGLVGIENISFADGTVQFVNNEVQISATDSFYTHYSYPDITTLTDGGYVVTWNSNQPGDYNIYAQRYDASGHALGNEIQVNTATAGNQLAPDITALADGGYVITWTSGGIYFQRFDANGNPVGSETAVTTYGELPAITTLTDGSYVVAWEGEDSSEVHGIYSQHYDPDGNTVGGVVLVNTSDVDRYSYEAQPAITALPDGGYVVTWSSGFSYADVYAQRYDASGNTVGGEVLVNTTTGGKQHQPAITALADGGYVVTWTSDGQDGIDFGIYAQRFDASGNTVGGEVQVNPTTVYYQDQPAITALADGGYVVTWKESDIGSGDIFTQRYDALNNPVGSAVVVNSTSIGNHEFPDITTLPDGGYVIVWIASFNIYSNIIGSGIYSQRFDATGNPNPPALLGDGNDNTIHWVGSHAIMISGGGGDDVLTGGSGNDLLDGGTGKDNLNGGLGDDTLWGSLSKDILWGDSGNDVLHGGAGLDTLKGGLGADTLWGETGNDILKGNAGDDVISGGAGNDTLNGGLGDDTLWGETGNDRLLGSSGNDVLHGGAGADTLKGNQGTDTLWGETGYDILKGNAGDDVLHGGAGDDTLRGGAGADQFYFGSPHNGSDLITDFDQAEGDLIALNGGSGTSMFQWGYQANGASHAHTVGALSSDFLLAANNLTNLITAVQNAADALFGSTKTSAAYFFGLTSAQHHLYYIVANHVSHTGVWSTTLSIQNFATLAGITDIGTGATQIDASDIVLF